MQVRNIILFLSFLFAISFSNSKAQPVNNMVGDVVMPPPNAAALGKYGDIPVSHSTGVPNISIPLGTVEEGDLKLDISVNYHASGVKVGEMASWVGQGWSLNAGGMISRTIQGIPDEQTDGFWNKGETIPASIQTMDDYYFYLDMGQGRKDGEPDIFSFNIGGYSGKFYINSNKEPVLIPKQDIKIEFDTRDGGDSSSYDHLYHFTITTPDGTKYHFGDKGTATQNGIEAYRTDDTNYMSTAWYLHTIESFDGSNKIDLHYDEEQYSYVSAGSCTYSTDNPPSQPVNCSGNLMTYQIGKRLTKIVSTNQTVNFIANTDRIDVRSEAKRLDVIEMESGNGIYCKRFDLSYGHFQDTSTEASNITYVNYRLRLNSIQERSCSGEIMVPPHSFTYNASSNYGDHYLPNRLSKAIDHWGFYNEAFDNNTNQMNIPYTSVTVAPPISLYPFTGSYGSSDRKTNEAAMLVGTLNKIDYPTGGYTKFTFEANDYHTIIDTTDRVLVNISSFCQVSPFSDAVLNASDLTFLNYDLSIESKYCVDSGVTPDEVKVSVSIGQTQLGEKVFLYDPANPPIPSEGDLSDLFPGVTFSSGVTYTFKVNSPYALTKFKVYGKPTLVSGNKKIGGLRLKEMKHHDDMDASKDIIKTYNYKKTNGQSSGDLYKLPVYASHYTIAKFCVPTEPGCVCNNSNENNGCPLTLPPCQQGGNSCQQYIYNYQYNGNPLIDNNFVEEGLTYLAFFDNSVVPLGSFEGYHIAYERVIENQNGNGSTEYNYYTENTYYPETFQYPAPPAQYRALEGKQLSTITKDESGNTLAVQSNLPKNDAYEYSTENIVKVITVSGWRNFFTHYKIRTRPYRLERVTNSLDGIVTEKTYTYNDSKPHLQVVSEQTSNSDGKIYETHYKYYDDYSSATVKDWLANKNIIETWQTSTYLYQNANDLNPEQIDGTRFYYNNFETSGDNLVYYPKTFHRFERTWDASGTLQSGSWQTEYEIDSYNTTAGKPNSITADGWEPTTYVWNGFGMLDSKSFIDKTWSYTYYTNSNYIQTITEPDGLSTTYNYDELGRLSNVTNDCTGVAIDYAYKYKDSIYPNTNYVSNVTTYPTLGTTVNQTVETVEIFDGLGRKIQFNKVGFANNGNSNIIISTEYDKFGRIEKEYEPQQNNFYPYLFKNNYSNNTNDYTSFAYYENPLNRIHQETPPSWHATTYEYGSNSSSIQTGTALTYNANELLVTTITDPNGNKTLAYTDKLGNEVLKENKSADGTETTKTCSHYDPKKRLIKVIPPGIAFNNDVSVYKFEYYGNDQVKEKKNPDFEGETYYYDTRDLLTHRQDANMTNKQTPEWYGYNHDAYGRILEEGLTTTAPASNTTTVLFSELLKSNTYGSAGIEVDRLISEEIKLLGTNDFITKTFKYDNCGRIVSTNGNHILDLVNGKYQYKVNSLDAAGNILNGVLNVSALAQRFTIANKFDYDKVGRKINEEMSFDPTIGYTKLWEKNFNHKEQLEKLKLGNTTGASYLQTIDYTYKPSGLLSSINNSATLGNDLFAQNFYYDEVGSFSNKPRLNGDITSIEYNTKYNSKLHKFKYEYDYLNRLTNSNDVYYSSNGTANYDKFKSTYGYDDRGNITNLTRNGKVLSQGGDADPFGDASGEIDNLTYTYLPNTNILKSIVDNATVPSGLINNPNITKLPDEGYKSISTQPYQYDDNGNIVYDPSKDMNITYNHLNLPSEISINNSSKTIQFIYDAIGTLHKRVATDPGNNYNKETAFIDNLEFTNNEIEYVHFENGYLGKGDINHCGGGKIIYNGEYGTDVKGKTITSYDNLNQNSAVKYTGKDEVILESGFTADDKDFTATINPFACYDWYYHYTIKDHLGNNRLVFADKNENGTISEQEIVQESHSYPFGLQMNLSGKTLDQGYNYKFNGNEQINELGLDYYDFNARQYDPSIGRFLNVDPLAELAPNWTPYRFGFNNPIFFNDPLGLYEWRVNSSNGEYERIGDKGNDKEQFIYWNNEKEVGYSMKGSTIYVGAVADNWHDEGKFSYTAHTVDLWSDVPDEYLGAYTGFDLVERYKAKVNNDIKYKDIVKQENEGKPRREQIWNSKDYVNYLDKKYGNTSGLVGAFDTKIIGPMLPGAGIANATNQTGKVVNGAKLSKSQKFNYSAVGQSGSNYSKNSWIRFLQQNKGKYKGLGKSWINQASKDYQKLKSAGKL